MISVTHIFNNSSIICCICNKFVAIIVCSYYGQTLRIFIGIALFLQ